MKDDNTGAAPDIQALLQEVERAVEEKKAQGIYDPAEVRKVEEAALSFSQAADDGDAAELGFRQARLEELWDATACAVTTHRSGLAGRLIAGAKRLMHRFTRPYLNVVLARQVQFNNELIRLLSVLVINYADLRFRLPTELEEVRRDSEARLSALERETGRGHAHLDAALARLQKIVQEQGQDRAAQSVAQLREAERGTAYLAFEDLHRGGRREIAARQEVYLPYFKEGVGEKAPLLDIGCGRGEFLELAKSHGLNARGLDINAEMVAFCRELGLEAEQGDALDYLHGLADESLGGIFLSQIIEHLGPDELTELVNLCAAKLKSGGALIAETLNPQSLSTFAGAFYVDITHVKPIHPEAARFLWRWAGLGEVDIIHRSPVPPQNRLENYKGPGDTDWLLSYNRNIDRLNQLLYGFLDYAVVGRK
jgi:O-antigen chain-terminating methyltransferase